MVIERDDDDDDDDDKEDDCWVPWLLLLLLAVVDVVLVGFVWFVPLPTAVIGGSKVALDSFGFAIGSVNSSNNNRSYKHQTLTLVCFLGCQVKKRLCAIVGFMKQQTAVARVLED
jgi:hypothetical protein